MDLFQVQVVRRTINYVLAWLIFCGVLLYILRFFYSILSENTPDHFVLSLTRLIMGMAYSMGIIAAAKFLLSEYRLGESEKS